MKLRMHVDQLTNSGGAKLAAELGATTADHLEKTDVQFQKHQSYQDAFSWLLGAGLCLLSATFVLGETVWSKVP